MPIPQDAVLLSERDAEVSLALQALSTAEKIALLKAIQGVARASGVDITEGQFYVGGAVTNEVTGVTGVPDTPATPAQIIAAEDDEASLNCENLGDATEPTTATQSGGDITLDFSTTLVRKTTISEDIDGTITLTAAPPHAFMLWIVDCGATPFAITTPNSATHRSPADLDTPDVIPIAANSTRFITIYNDGTNVHWLPGLETRANA